MRGTPGTGVVLLAGGVGGPVHSVPGRLEEGSEGFSEGLAGAVEAQFDCFGGGVGDGGDLVVGEVLVGGEDEGFALVCGELGDGGLDGGEFFLSGKRFGGVWGEVG